MIFFFNDTATTEIYTLSLHDALPIYAVAFRGSGGPAAGGLVCEGGRLARRDLPLRPCPLLPRKGAGPGPGTLRSEEHTSELQSRQYLVCRLLLEKKNINISYRVLCFK